MISDEWKLRLTRGMQLLLVAMTLLGFYVGESKFVVNSVIGLLISFLPSLLERDPGISLSPGLVIWIISALFLHALGSAGFYTAIPWWGHLTHSLSASLVAEIGYTVVRSVDIHSEEVRLPDRFMFVFILMTVLAFGVVWELFEYGLDIIANITKLTMPLAQHGLEDTMKDMTFNTIGALIVAVLGQAHLNDLAEKLMAQLDDTG
jgi:hypothetical protein